MEEDLSSQKHAFEMQLTEVNNKLSEVEAKREALVSHSHERELKLSAELFSAQQSAEIVKSNLLQAHSQQLIELQKELLDIMKQNHQREQQLDDEKKANQQLQNLIRNLQDELIDIRSGLSWRITSPFRDFAAWIRFSPRKVASTFRFSEQANITTIPTLELDGSPSATQYNTFKFINPETSFKAIDYNAQAPQSVIPFSTSNLKTLLQQNDEQFIHLAYLTLLRRPPDTEGLTFYLNKLSKGVPKLRILGQIVASAEARKLDVTVPGLNKAIRQQKMIGVPLFGWIFQIFMDDESSICISSLNDLLSHNGNEFIENTYLTLLKRKPDSNELIYYAEQLYAGQPKIQILGQILNSVEAKTTGVELPGLRNTLMLHKLARLPLVCYVIRRIRLASS